MKKFILGLLIIVGILVAVFYQEIMATRDFYVFQRENLEIMARSIVNWKQMPFSSADYSATADSFLSIHSLNIPVTFAAVEGKSEVNEVRAYSNSKSITVSTTAEPEDFLATHGFVTEK